MSDPAPQPVATVATVDATVPRASAGALLRAGREAAGLSVDAVAQHLRLAPRQVTALEEDDYTHLPGRTFVRGFVRNYARFVRLDANQVLAALPGSTAAPALAAPTLHQTAPTMGELPVTDHAGPRAARWAIPLSLAAIVVAAAMYEWLRPPGNGKVAPTKAPTSVATDRPAAAPAAALPNPLAVAPAGTPVAVPGQQATTASAPTASAPTAAAPTGVTPAELAASGAAMEAASAQLVLVYRDYSWTEVKDREGRVLVSRMNAGGTTQALAGAPPLELVIGNAADVSVTYRGKPVDLGPHTRQNVARFTLP